MKKLYTFICVAGLSLSAHAGMFGVTHHSRANCANNESVSWDKTSNHWFWVESSHGSISTGAVLHVIRGEWDYTWRDADVHWGEGTGGYFVMGTHFMTDAAGNPHLVAYENVTNCSVYDGWWG